MGHSCLLVLVLSIGVGLGVVEPVNSESYMDQSNSYLTTDDWHQQHEYLLRYNFLPESYRESGRNATPEEFFNAITDLQYMAGLPETGTVDNRTQELLGRERCGIVDNVTTYREYHQQSRNSQRGWPQRDIIWSVMRYGNPDMSFNVVARIVPLAFEFWQVNTNWSFNQELMQRNDVDITIAFEKGFHGDSLPFNGDSPGHTFPRDDRENAEVHLDARADWNSPPGSGETGVLGKVSLLSVLIHEIGHALGLHHSTDPSSVMYPWFSTEPASTFQLTNSDALQIQSLQAQGPGCLLLDYHYYGRRPEADASTSKPSNPATTQLPDPHHHCVVSSLHSALYARGKAFFFKNQTYWMLKSNDIENMHIRRPIHEFWYDLPENVTHIDAAYENPDTGHVLFFVNRKYYRLKTNRLSPNFPKLGRPITEFGLPYSIEKVDAIFVWAHNQQTYIITGDMYWKYDERKRKLLDTYPRDMRLWRGVTTPVDAAITMFNDELYFISGDIYERFDSWEMRVVERGPLSRLMGCLSVNMPGEKNQSYHSNGSNHRNIAGHLQPDSDYVILQYSLFFLISNILVL